MNIKNDNHLNVNQILNRNLKRSDSGFSDLFDANLRSLNLQKRMDKDILEFKNNLTKDGASSYVLNSNNNKISQRLEHKKAELSNTLGLYDKDLSSEDKERLNALLNGFLSEYAKKLKYNKSFNNLIEQKQKELGKQNKTITLENLIKDLEV